MKETVIIAAILLLLTACSSSDEVLRVASPDRKADAVLIETNGGATTDFGYEVYVTPSKSSPSRGKRVADLYGAVRNESAYGVNLRWMSPQELRIEYLKAKIETLEKPFVEVSGNRIQILLNSGITDSIAPAGGMLYNLDKRQQTKR